MATKTVDGAAREEPLVQIVNGKCLAKRAVGLLALLALLAWMRQVCMRNMDAESAVESKGLRFDNVGGHSRTPMKYIPDTRGDMLGVPELGPVHAVPVVRAMAPARTVVLAPAGCANFFDGCNSCVREVVGGPMACTEMACFRAEKTRCDEWFADGEEEPTMMADEREEASEGPPENCQLWYDGCNRCHRGEVGGGLACTRMMCPPGSEKDAKCLKFFSNP